MTAAAAWRTLPAMLIRPVAYSPHLPLVATWLHAEWWAAGGHALAEAEAFLRRATGPGLPCALVAERDGVALGTATLDTEDLPSRPDLSPWLASVLVAPAYRRQGVATALVAEVRRRAAALAYPRLWLFTGGQAAFYASLGWSPEGAEQYRGQPVTLMSCVP
ncbi:GNAT family N-acetyltransferase [Falsiroseomonas sp. E2-1-a4]|uniref:GNAT family N-acetyltransferase n=1 Tax=Falsiroseomonas sp. E2-1-a4 TaxID=3239299 RepID=UPI003F3A7AB3